MHKKTLFIKNMVCDRCKLVVKDIVAKHGLTPVQIRLGSVDVEPRESTTDMASFVKELNNVGFDLITSRKERIMEEIKITIQHMVRSETENSNFKLSELLASKFNQDYSALSNQFSSSQNVTIEKYYIIQKVTRVKELLEYDELSISEIAFELNYSSIGYLSYQFKKNTGLTPTAYKKQFVFNRT